MADTSDKAGGSTSADTAKHCAVRTIAELLASDDSAELKAALEATAELAGFELSALETYTLDDMLDNAWSVIIVTNRWLPNRKRALNGSRGCCYRATFWISAAGKSAA